MDRVRRLQARFRNSDMRNLRGGSWILGRSSVCGSENCMKHFRRFATRYDRRAIHFKGFIYLLAAMILLR